MPTLTARAARCALSLVPVYNGKGRIVDRTFLSRLRFTESTLEVETIDGPMSINPNDLIGRTIYLTRTFDRCVADVLEDLAKPGDTLWDIGANIGYISLSFLARVPRSRVVAIEPLSDVFAMLQRNLASDRATCLCCAISDHAGAGSMVRTQGNLGKSHLGDAGEPVRLQTGDDISTYGRPNLIKIDTEGHEAAVLRGLVSILPGVRSIVFECHHWPDSEILATIVPAGFHALQLCRRWSGWVLAPMGQTPAGYEPSADMVAVRDVEEAIAICGH